MSHLTPVEKRTARKEHRCEWCFTTIEVGESHNRWAGTEEGQWYSMRVHLDCYDAMTREWHEVGDDFVSVGEVHRRAMTMTETEDALDAEYRQAVVLSGGKA